MSVSHPRKTDKVLQNAINESIDHGPSPIEKQSLQKAGKVDTRMIKVLAVPA